MTRSLYRRFRTTRYYLFRNGGAYLVPLAFIMGLALGAALILQLPCY